LNDIAAAEEDDHNNDNNDDNNDDDDHNHDGNGANNLMNLNIGMHDTFRTMKRHYLV
jgi:hypothetical protein